MAAPEIDSTDGINIGNVLIHAGNVDGRDVSVDGTKLDGIDSGADVTGSNPPQAHGASVHTDRTRKVFYDNPHFTDGTRELKGVQLPDGSDKYVAYYVKMPEDFASWSKLNVLYVINDAGANQVAVIDINAYYGSDTEAYNIHTDSKTVIDINMTGITAGNIQTYTHADINMPNLTKNDYVLFKIMRDGDHGFDDWVHEIVIIGIEIEYTSDM